MKLKPYTRIYLLQIIPFGLIWMVAAIIYLLLERSLLGGLDYYPATGNPYNFKTVFPMVLICSFLIGVGIGMIEVFILSKLFLKGGFGKKFILKALIYAIFMIMVLIALSTIGNMMLQQFSLSDAGLWKNIWNFFSSMPFWTMELYIAATIVVSLFFYEVSGNLGNDVLLNFLSGRYYTPTEEERIFLFVDMKSSTTIAEKLGHVRYFELLRDYYAVISTPILRHGGEIYQYVGDEIVITWRVHKGDNVAFLRCFYEMKEELQNQSSRFLTTFGVAPTFKAGVHCGRVTTGEIGVIKQDIIFSGDVLNTAARIQGLCNELRTEILVSSELKEAMDNDPQVDCQSMGFHELRGREKGEELFTATLLK